MSAANVNPLPWKLVRGTGGMYIVTDAKGFALCEVRDGFSVALLLEKVNKIADLVLAAEPFIYGAMLQSKEDMVVYRVTYKGLCAERDYGECLAFLKNARELLGRELFGSQFTDGWAFLDEEGKA